MLGLWGGGVSKGFESAWSMRAKHEGFSQVSMGMIKNYFDMVYLRFTIYNPKAVNALQAALTFLTF